MLHDDIVLVSGARHTEVRADIRMRIMMIDEHEDEDDEHKVGTSSPSSDDVASPSLSPCEHISKVWI